MSIFTNPSKVLGHFWDWFSGESQIVLAFLKPTIVTLEQKGGAILITAAENAVVAGAAAGGGQTAMAAALVSFTAEVTAKGIPFIESQARQLIETALQNARAALPVAA